MIEFFFLRHGETEYNVKKIVQGQLDSPLTEKGKQSAKDNAHFLEEAKFDIIISSDTGRAYETAKIMANILGLEIIKSEKLREVNYGDYSGIKREEIKAKCLQYKKDKDYVFPNGESFQQVYDRVIKFVKSLEGKYKRVIIVTHHGPLRAIYCYFNNLNFEENLNMQISHTKILHGVLKSQEPELLTYVK
jgi:phosphoserine phosphatase